MVATQSVTRGEVEKLRTLLAERAFMRKADGSDFVLASGRRSKLYFESKNVTLSPEGILPIGRLFRDLARHLGAVAVGGLAVGSVPISTAVVACEAIDSRAEIRSFYVRDSAKTHGTERQMFEAFAPGAETLIHQGTPVLVVDDVLTTGGSISKAMDFLIGAKVEVKAIAVLVDRQEGGASALKDKYGVPVIAMFQADAEGNLAFLGHEV